MSAWPLSVGVASERRRLHWLAVPVPLVDVRAQYERLIPRILERFQEVLESGTLILGPNVQAFEEEAAAYLGVPQTVGVANGTDALVLVLDALGIGAGDEVICPSFTFYATAEAIMRTGATPAFADIDPISLNVDAEDVAAKVTERTRAIMPVHLFGRPADLAPLAALGVPIIEDAAQAFGAQGVATTGVASTFSFFPTKNLFALGDGGLVAAGFEDGAVRLVPAGPHVLCEALELVVGGLLPQSPGFFGGDPVHAGTTSSAGRASMKELTEKTAFPAPATP